MRNIRLLGHTSILVSVVISCHLVICYTSLIFEDEALCPPDSNCINITSCPRTLTDIPSGNYPKICGWSGLIPWVCCAVDPSVIESPEFRKISPEGCGVRMFPETVPRSEYDIDPRISPPSNYLTEEVEPDFSVPSFTVGGDTARVKWPWMVAIYKTNKKRQLCGGTLIDDRHILTAAHCFAGKSLNPELYSVQVGELVINDTFPYYAVQEIKTHENYNPRYDYDDIAIIRLDNPLPCDVIPACLSNVDEVEVGEELSILGWGHLSLGGPFTTKLQEVHGLRVVSNTACNDAFQKLQQDRLSRGIWDKFICAGVTEGGKDACKGDSGGPLLKFNSNDDTWSLVGIISFGYKCGLPGFPGVYTKVSSYQHWISQYVEMST